MDRDGELYVQAATELLYRDPDTLGFEIKGSLDPDTSGGWTTDDSRGIFHVDLLFPRSSGEICLLGDAANRWSDGGVLHSLFFPGLSETG